jgi:hypothetical protein
MCIFTSVRTNLLLTDSTTSSHAGMVVIQRELSQWTCHPWSLSRAPDPTCGLLQLFELGRYHAARLELRRVGITMNRYSLKIRNSCMMTSLSQTRLEKGKIDVFANGMSTQHLPA